MVLYIYLFHCGDIGVMENPLFENLEEFVKKRLLEDGCTLESLSEELMSLFPNQPGFRYCIFM